MRVIDPVCGKELAEEEASTLSFGDETFFFCSDECRDEFEQNAGEYLDSEAILELAAEAPK